MGFRTILSAALVATATGLVGTADASVAFYSTTNGCSDPACLLPTGNVNKAKATFTITGNFLTILLENLSDDPASGAAKPGDGLTGISFALPGSSLVLNFALGTKVETQSGIYNFGACNTDGPGLEPCSALAVTDVTGEFGFSSSYPSAGNYGIASAGYVPSTLAGSTNIDNPDSPNGPNFSIISVNWSAGEMNPAFSSLPHITAAALITLPGALGLFESSIANVLFYYGTAPDGPGRPGCTTLNEIGVCGTSVPEPSSLPMLLVAILSLLGFGYLGMSRRARA